MKHYVLGFAFDFNGDSVVLIRKNKPAWQAGLYNGVGGKIEEGEVPLVAMIREFQEETGVETDPTTWNFFAKMHGPDWDCVVYSAFGHELTDKAATLTDEKVTVFPSNNIPTSISNLKFLIPAALNHRERGQEFVLSVSYDAN